MPYIDKTEHQDLTLFYAEYHKKRASKRYDTLLYKSGESEYLVKYDDIIYAQHLDWLIDTLYKVAPKNTEMILMHGIPSTVPQREIFLKKTKFYIISPWARKILNSIDSADEQSKMKIKQLSTVNVAESEIGKIVGQDKNTTLYVATMDSLSNLLSAIQYEYQGKIILLDLWGTWCGPCLSDIKKTKPLLDDMQKNGIQIIYLCEGNGSKKATWRETVSKLGMTGPQVYLPGDITDQFENQFDITGYPSHIIIDVNGDFHSDKNHTVSSLDPVALAKKYGKKR
jgi:thiol-disulfide isomerase/thioredoxin